MSASQVPPKSRSDLKKCFKNGCMPDQKNFSDLIDAMVHRDDLSLPSAAMPDPAPASPGPGASPADGWQFAAGRIGSYAPLKGAAQLERAVNLVRLGVPADGKRHVIMPDMTDCYGFEIVASASGRVDSNNHAITHAVVLISFGASDDAILQTASYQGWDCRRKIVLKWVRRGAVYDLHIGTRVSFGNDEQGKPVQIQYHVTRMW